MYLRCHRSTSEQGSCILCCAYFDHSEESAAGIKVAICETLTGCAEGCKSMRDAELTADVRLKSLIGLASCSLVKLDRKAAAVICKRLLADSNLSSSDSSAILSLQGWAHFESGNLEVR